LIYSSITPALVFAILLKNFKRFWSTIQQHSSFAKALGGGSVCPFWNKNNDNPDSVWQQFKMPGCANLIKSIKTSNFFIAKNEGVVLLKKVASAGICFWEQNFLSSLK
jgi:hypothetical protein